MLEKLLSFLNSEAPLTRKWGMFCAVLTIFISTAISVSLQDKARTDDYRVQQIVNMQDSMIQFQTFAAAFAAEMNEKGNVSSETRNKLLENLNDQFGRIRVLQHLESEIDSKALGNYQQKVSSMIKAVTQANNTDSMRQFWSAASDLLYARNELNYKLRANI